MKQPELGIKIAELRKTKGLTQEEVVDKCNISIRTLQRIEAGEVSPRAYTIKTIMGVLDYDFNEIYGTDKKRFDTFIIWLKKLLLIDIDSNSSSDYAIKQLNLAWIFGIIYFILFFFIAALEHIRFLEEGMIFSDKLHTKYFRFMKDRIVFNNWMYLTIKLLGLITFVYFQRGFILIGGIFSKVLLLFLKI